MRGRKKTIVFIGIAVLLLAFGYFFVLPAVKVVRQFEDFSSAQSFEDGEKLELDSLQLYHINSGKDSVVYLQGVRILNFWASWCQPCLAEMGSLKQLQDNYPWLSVNLVSFEDSVSQRKTLDKIKIGLPAFYIQDSSRFDVPAALPRTIILKDDIVIRDIYGNADWMKKKVREMIDTLALRNFK